MYASSADAEISQSVSKLTSFRSLKLVGVNSQLGSSTILRPAKAAATNTAALLLRNEPLTSNGSEFSLDERLKYHLCGPCCPLVQEAFEQSAEVVRKCPSIQKKLQMEKNT
jgi:hypothetical protein